MTKVLRNLGFNHIIMKATHFTKISTMSIYRLLMVVCLVFFSLIHANAQDDSRTDEGIRRTIEMLKELSNWDTAYADIASAALKNPDPDCKERLYIDALGKLMMFQEKEAAELFVLAGKKGQDLAIGYACTIYIEHTRQLEKAIQLAEQGYVEAQCSLALDYYFGKGVSKNLTEAVRWSTKAAEQGDANAQFILGYMYKKGEGVAKDEKKAVEWFTKAAEQGHASAQYNLGNMYYHGGGVAKDEKKAVEWYTKAAEQGHASAQFILGYMYYYGEGVAKDLIKAVEWYEKAAEKGENRAQLYLGYLYEKGDGVEKDQMKALEWYTKAAEKGNTSALNQMAYIYAKQQEYTKAIEAIDRAISLQPKDANYYDSKGEILLMKGDEQGARTMWNKVLEVDPDFLSKYEGGTDLYKKLKEKKLIED